MPTLNYSTYNRAIESAINEVNRAMERRIEAENKLNDTTSDPITAAALQRYLDQEEYVRQLEVSYATEKEKRIAEIDEQIQNYRDLIDEAETDPVIQRAEEAIQAYEDAQIKADEAAAIAQEARDNYSWISQIDNPSEDEITAREDAYRYMLEMEDASREASQIAAEKKQEKEDLEYEARQTLAIINEYYQRISDLQAERDSYSNDTAHYEKIKEAMAKRDAYLEEYTRLAGGLESEYQDALYAEEAANIALQAAYDDLAYAQERNSIDVASTGVDLQEIADQITVQQEKIKALAGDEENVITANVSGVIDTIDCTAGDTVNKDALLCTIEVPDMGHTLSFSVTNDQAQRLRIGDTATISNYYWGNSVTATLTTIRTDPKNPQTNKVLTFALEGDVTSGAEMTISVGQKSANYDIIVPNSAIKSDNNGSFVLVVQVKSSPLGNRYTAKRVSVEVLAKDDNNAAVVADLNNGDYVITTSSSPVSSGDMVRIADNQT